MRALTRACVAWQLIRETNGVTLQEPVTDASSE